MSQIDPVHALTSHFLENHLCLYKGISPGSRRVVIFRNDASFYDEELLAPRPTPKLEDHHLWAVRDCLFNIFAATLYMYMCVYIYIYIYIYIYSSNLILLLVDLLPNPVRHICILAVEGNTL
jgi:hypothetical protein